MLSSSGEWRRQIAAVDAQILAHLREGVAGGFDEASYGDRMGFAALQRCSTRRAALKRMVVVQGRLSLPITGRADSVPAFTGLAQDRCCDASRHSPAAGRRCTAASRAGRAAPRLVQRALDVSCTLLQREICVCCRSLEEGMATTNLLSWQCCSICHLCIRPI